MNILIAIEELRIGGAQTFALRLAQALHEAGNRVYLYNMYWQFTENDLLKRLAPDVELLQYQPRTKLFDNVLMRAEGWLERRGKSASLRYASLRKHLTRIIREKNIEVVHSQTFKCDHLLALVLGGFPQIPLVVTMHGDYEQFLAFYRFKTEYVIPDYPQKLTKNLARINGIAYLSDQNLEVLRPEVALVSTTHIHLKRIYNGLSAHFSAEASHFTRAALSIPVDAFVFGMVARGVPEKGWEPLILAYQRLKNENTRPVHLILVGSSHFLSSLKERYHDDANLHFLGFVNNPVDCVATFDVGVLASSLKESLPNSIAEYLFCGKPVISTDVGEIQRMLTTDEEQEAGLLISFPEQGLADSQELYQAMHQYVANEPMLNQHQQYASQAFAKFDMGRCVKAYTELYRVCQLQI